MHTFNTNQWQPLIQIYAQPKHDNRWCMHTFKIKAMEATDIYINVNLSQKRDGPILTVNISYIYIM